MILKQDTIVEGNPWHSSLENYKKPLLDWLFHDGKFKRHGGGKIQPAHKQPVPLRVGFIFPPPCLLNFPS